VERLLSNERNAFRSIAYVDQSPRMLEQVQVSLAALRTRAQRCSAGGTSVVD